ncbi:MAG: DUF1266 domain-containing protein [Candidatus Accumulibacter sp.]|jgi:hypothetical protein|nr:DUF1266 domain-containing protein [Accumulibacter sp.]
MAAEKLGRLIFEIDGKPQRKGLFKKKSHLAFYKNGIVIDELGDHIEILKKNIANVYYSAPTVGDYDCVTVEIDHYDEGAIDTYPFDETTWDGIFARVDRLLDYEWNEFRKQKSELPDHIKWFNAVNAVSALSGEGDAELFGGDVKSPEVAVAVREALFECWEVNIRQDLLNWFEKLYAGRSAKQAQEIIDEITSEGGNPKNLNESSLHYLEWMQSKYAIAWDMGRMIWIASQGYLADYLSHDEAVAYCVKAGKKLQSLFNGWDEMFHHYMQGYIYWSEDDPDDEECEAYQRICIYNWLKTLPKSPYRIYWDTKLEQ